MGAGGLGSGPGEGPGLGSETGSSVILAAGATGS